MVKVKNEVRFMFPRTDVLGNFLLGGLHPLRCAPHLPNDNLNMVELNRWTGRLLCGFIGYICPIDLLKKAMAEML